jgi:glucosyl-dolichyl phosphate glucuronosyltransferase
MISVIVCTYNRSESLAKTLGSLAQLLPPAGTPWELIVVDNNSKDDTAEVVSKFSQASSLSVRYVLERNQGLSHARNAGVRRARGDIIAFTDDDVTVDPRWLCELQKIFIESDSTCVAGRIVPVWNSEKPSWLRLEGPQALRSGTVVSFDLGEEPCELNDTPPVGANMAFKTVVFEKYGFFRSDLGKRGNDPMLGEEVEFCARLSRAGDKLVYAPAAVVYHPVPMERLEKRYFRSYYFNYGRYEARRKGFPKRVTLFFGVPRYLFRSLMADIGRWLLCFDSPQRFRLKLEVWESLGEIRELHRISAEGK